MTIYPPFFTEHRLGTWFGENVFVNQGSTFLDLDDVSIGDGVMIGPRVNLITSGHPLLLAERRKQVVSVPIVIEDDVWIGAAATVTPGVRIGAGAVVAAGAVVTRDVPARCLAAGLPARVLRRID